MPSDIGAFPKDTLQIAHQTHKHTYIRCISVEIPRYYLNNTQMCTFVV